MNANGKYETHIPHKPSSRKPLGKLAQRVEEVKNPWRPSSTLELSHSEAARLATDALLESGPAAYRRALTEERELPFLSQLEIAYITLSPAAELPVPTAELGEGGCRRSLALSEQTSLTYFPMQSDSEAPLLDLGWSKPHNSGSLPSETHIIFQRDKTHSIKDTIRRLLSEAKSLIAIVMDLFTDVDILCDLLEASNKRRVPVYLLLDESHLEHFMFMCDELDIQKDHLHNMRIRSVMGDTYCTKSGKKFNGQVLEKFMIVDLEQVVAGSYSFTWLSGQVHLNFVTLLTGQVVQAFDDEFRCLYAESKPIERFSSPVDVNLCYYTSNLRMPPEHHVEEWLAEPVPSNPSSSLSSSSPHSVVQSATPAAKVLWERKQTSPCASNNTPVIDRKIKEINKSSNNWSHQPLAKPNGFELFDPKPNYDHGVHYPNNTRLRDHGAAVKQRGNPVVPSRTTKILKDGLSDARTLTPPSSPPRAWNANSPKVSRGEVLRRTEQHDDRSRDSHQPSGGLTRSTNRMTLGHSKLDMMVEYNDKMKARNLFSRFQLMKHDP
ncbi:protein FAM83C [Heptranchias perlo]|uniref:protein FAM83C n=1 Tax=Heptranchias perlo TaxID=212740 RepID=UPI00355960A4